MGIHDKLESESERRVKELKRIVGVLQGLADDPQPGLSTYMEALSRAVGQLHELVEGKAEPEVRGRWPDYLTKGLPWQ